MVLRGLGEGSFGAGERTQVGDGARSVCAADIDGDCDADALVAVSGDDHLAVLVNNGHGDFAPSLIDVGDGPRHVTTADLDGDGVPEAIVTNRFSNSISIVGSISIIGAGSRCM